MKKPRWENDFKGQYEEGIFFLKLSKLFTMTPADQNIKPNI